MSEGDVELLRGVYAAWGRGDFNTGYAFDPQVEFARIGSDDAGVAGEWRGMDEMLAAIGDWMREWEDVRIEAERFIELGDRVLVLSHQYARGKRSGAPVDHELGDIFTVREGKIVRLETYWDRAEAMRAAGVAP